MGPGLRRDDDWGEGDAEQRSFIPAAKIYQPRFRCHSPVRGLSQKPPAACTFGGTDCDDFRFAAPIAAPPGLPPAAALGVVDIAPVQRPRAERRHDPPCLVVGGGRGWSGTVLRRPTVYRLVVRPVAAVRLERRPVLPSVQRLAASVVGYRQRP